jgi:hypothetical protein
VDGSRRPTGFGSGMGTVPMYPRSLVKGGHRVGYHDPFWRFCHGLCEWGAQDEENSDERQLDGTTARGCSFDCRGRRNSVYSLLS